MTNQKNTNKKPSRFNFNVIDMLIVLIIVAAVFFVVYCIILGNDLTDIGAKSAELEYSVIIPRADIKFKDSISQGDKVTDPETGKNLGTVKSVEYSFSTEHVTDAEGNEKLYSNPNKIDLLVTISCTAKIKGDSCYVGGVLLTVGSYINVHFTNYSPAEKSYVSDVKLNG